MEVHDQNITTQDPGFYFWSSVPHCTYMAVYTLGERDIFEKTHFLTSCHLHLHCNAIKEQVSCEATTEVAYYRGCQCDNFSSAGNGAKFSYANPKP